MPNLHYPQGYTSCIILSDTRAALSSVIHELHYPQRYTSCIILSDTRAALSAPMSQYVARRAEELGTDVDLDGDGKLDEFERKQVKEEDMHPKP